MPGRRSIKEHHPDNVFKDKLGRWRTQSLFREWCYGRELTLEPLYTMKDDDITIDYKGSPLPLPSFKRLYLELEDLTEWEVATQLLGGWPHFQNLLTTKWFKEFITPIREELEIKMRSKALLSLYSAASKNNVSAAKYIAEGRYKGLYDPAKGQFGRGRPSKEEVRAEKVRLIEIGDQVDEDMKRIGLTFDPAKTH